jgi:hypothetical protein
VPNYTTKVSANPAGDGSEHSYTLTEELILKHAVFALVTDSNAANRNVQVTIEDADGNVFFRIAAGGVQIASKTYQYVLREGDFTPPALLDTVLTLPIPKGGITIPSGGKIKTVTTAVQATDNYGVMTIRAERP